MKRLLAWAGSADSTITNEAVMAMAEKFNTGQEVCLQLPSTRGVMQVKEGTSAPTRRSRRMSRKDNPRHFETPARSSSRRGAREHSGLTAADPQQSLAEGLNSLRLRPQRRSCQRWG